MRYCWLLLATVVCFVCVWIRSSLPGCVSSRTNSGRCQMRSRLTGHVGFLPRLYFTVSSSHHQQQAATAAAAASVSSASLHHLQSTPVLPAAAAVGGMSDCCFVR